MRNKSENEARDRYARLYAASLAAEALITFHSRDVEILITVEAEDDPLWDDILELDSSTGKRKRHQVKRQFTDLSADDFSKYVKAAAEGDENVEYHFAYPVPISVVDVGEIRILSGLCGRVQQEGANPDKVLAALRPAERKWMDSLGGWTAKSDGEVLELLRRIHIDIIGTEELLEKRAALTLGPRFGHGTEEAWGRIVAYVSDKDGVVDIGPKQLLEKLPAPTGDAIDAFYWSIIRSAEYDFALDRWVDITDHLTTDLMPQWFHDGVLRFAQTVASSAWPGRCPTHEAAIQNLANRGHEYIRYFDTRSESDGRLVREDKSFKRHLKAPAYQIEEKAAAEWRKRVSWRLINMVVAVNELFDAVRSDLDNAYRLLNGKFGIHDSMGVWNEDGNPAVYHFKKYMDLTEKPASDPNTETEGEGDS